MKKVSETNFPQIKAYTTKYGVEKAQEKFGYSARTLRSIAKADNYPTWRGTRKAKQPKRAPKVETTPPAAPVKPQAIQPVAPNQSVTTPQIKKPGHGRSVPQAQQAAVVSTEKYERDTNRLYKENQLLREEKAKLIEKVTALEKEVRAAETFDEVERDILANDRARKSRLRCFVDGFRRGKS
ncbi:hypothetical protein [Rhodococcus sp. B10]|uniref:hypothetical protein n=1 Tax=Rhodococcus sp. B10 TaxID=2695876 RepID=UPI001430EC89|nr:hypothetical protein [Rhodococcus sp. B10]